jgi:hypothetical protein
MWAGCPADDPRSQPPRCGSIHFSNEDTEDPVCGSAATSGRVLQISQSNFKLEPLDTT